MLISNERNLFLLRNLPTLNDTLNEIFVNGFGVKKKNRKIEKLKLLKQSLIIIVICPIMNNFIGKCKIELININHY